MSAYKNTQAYFQASMNNNISFTHDDIYVLPTSMHQYVIQLNMFEYINVVTDIYTYLSLSHMFAYIYTSTHVCGILR